MDMTNDSSSIDDWLGHLHRGEVSTLANIFDHYRPMLRQMVKLRSGTQLAARLDPSDVLQDTYLDATQKVQAYLNDPKVSVFVWLRGLTWDRLAKLQREHLGTQRRAIHREVQLPEGSSVMLAGQLMGGMSPKSQVVKSELRRRVEQALNQLKSADREIILMRYFEGMSNNQIAEALNLTSAGATMRHGRAIVRLKNLLDSDLSLGDLA